MLQKIVNGIAIASGVVSLAVVGTVGYVYVRKDAIIENVKGKIMESVLPSIGLPLVVLNKLEYLEGSWMVRSRFTITI